MRRGFTLIETLAVVAIIGVLVAILSPTIAAARRSGQITSSVARLHQIHLSATLYSQDWNGGHDYGTAAEMGLPPLELIARNRLGLGIPFWHSPCSNTPPDSRKLDYTWSPSNDKGFVEIVNRLKGNTLLSTDVTCNDTDLPPRSVWVRRRVLGVTLDGALLNRYRAGDPFREEWWTAP